MQNAVNICQSSKKTTTTTTTTRRWFQVHYAQWFCDSAWPQHTLQMFADYFGPIQIKPRDTINQGRLQPKGELYPIQTIYNHHSQDQLLEFLRQSAVSSLSKGISSILNFHESIGTNGTRTRISCVTLWKEALHLTLPNDELTLRLR